MVRSLIDSGELLTVEFKHRRNRNDFGDNDLAETVACLANGRGGKLLIGVEDDGSVTGCFPWHVERTDPHRLEALIQNRTRPSLATSVHVIELAEGEVVVVEVPDHNMPIGTSRGVYQRRAAKTDGTPECIAFEPHDLLLSQFTATGRDWAQLPALGAGPDSLDPAEFRRFRALCKSASGDRMLTDLADDEILRALDLTDISNPKQVTVGAILLFGTEEAIRRAIPNHEVTFQVLDRNRLLTNDLLRTPLFKVAQQLQERLEARNVEDEMPWGLLRLSLPRIPPTVAREAIANALVHRDYTALGPTAVSLNDQMFSVSSPGGLPRGVTLSNLLDVSQPRSRVLADAFKRAGIVERSGRGIAIMYREMLQLGRYEPDYSQTTDNRVVVSFPMETADKDLVGFVRAVQEKGTDLALAELRVLHLLRVDGALSLRELSEELSLAKDRLRGVLNRMDENGLVEIRGTGRHREYHLTPAFYEAAGRRGGYVRSAPIDTHRREEMILRYIKQFGRITRSEAAELCGLPATQASQTLRTMASNNQIRLRGERRGAHYVLPDS